MTILPFKIDDANYCINIDSVVEVIPLVQINRIPKSGEHLLGLINFRGDLLPVFDLCYYLKQKYTNRYLSTRIIIVKDKINPNIEFGIVSDEVSETYDIEQSTKQENIDSYTSHPFIDEVYLIDYEMIHLMNLKKIISSLENYL
jgi:chemotaxis signal transduction protein